MPNNLLPSGKSTAIISVLLAAAVLLSACSGFGNGTRPVRAENIGLDPEGPGHAVSLDPALMEAQSRFALNLYRELVGDEGVETDGVFISPASIALALAMTYNGARGETAEGMARALELGDLSLDEVNGSYYALIQALSEAPGDDTGVVLRIANGIWQDEGHSFYDDFLARNRQYYGARAEAMDFGDPAVLRMINAWVAEQTEGRIEDLIEEIGPDTIMFLVNAIYFKGDWVTPFPAEGTRPALFHRPAENPVEVPLMHLEEEFEYYRGDGFQAVRLPYGKPGGSGDDGNSGEPETAEAGARLAMYVFLPEEDAGLDDFHGQLTYENWHRWLGGFERKTGLVALPRFRMEYKAQLNEQLKALGMDAAFDAGRADFGGMTPVAPGRNVYIGEVLHQTFLEVNEKGSEAAGATSVEMRIESAMMTDFEFTADRPFFAAIVDDDTGAILFAGSITDPKPVE